MCSYDRSSHISIWIKSECVYSPKTPKQLDRLQWNFQVIFKSALGSFKFGNDDNIKDSLAKCLKRKRFKFLACLKTGSKMCFLIFSFKKISKYTIHTYVHSIVYTRLNTRGQISIILMYTKVLALLAPSMFQQKRSTSYPSLQEIISYLC